MRDDHYNRNLNRFIFSKEKWKDATCHIIKFTGLKEVIKENEKEE